MNICKKIKCTGCSACLNTCLHDAIQLIENEKGFLYPEIDESKCVDCGLCVKTCPVNCETDANTYKAVYAALDKRDEDRAKSTSGGIFAVLAKHIIKQGGYVYGAALDNDLVVRHIEVHTFECLDKLRNSKYVQSEIGYSYQNAKKRLRDGALVLFSGTPCQIAGLKNYLGKEYSNLLTIDILCHGVPSPGVFRKYIKSEEKIVNSKLVDIQFRSKGIGWKKLLTDRYFENGQKADWGDTFVPGFLNNYYLRESCYSCVYATDKRQGDITLGDYWGYKESAPEYIEDDDKGISLVIINTEKGQNAFNGIRRDIAFAKKSMEDAKQGNPVLYKPCDKPDDYMDFWNDYQTMSWKSLSEKYIQPQDRNDWMKIEKREYYDIPFVKRYRMHKRHIYINKIYHKLKRIGGRK